ncbi:MAG: hypothetical protein HUJ56_10355 [Erysipelotrichaceae bacterium]|nr:hypothetical protein [Erysipelotrichaceae bacterium]
MATEISTLLEFKLVDNFHRIVNLSNTYSIDDMKSGEINNAYKLVPVSACSDNWKNNITSDYKLDYSKVELLQVVSITDNDTESFIDVDPSEFELYADTTNFGGLTVSFASNAPDLEIGSQLQYLKGVFLINAVTDAVLAYSIIPNPVPVVNYIRFPNDGFVVEIRPTVSMAMKGV